jgi:hypothetical protein
MQNETQTTKSLDIKAIVKLINSTKRDRLPPKTNCKVVFPYIELYNRQKKENNYIRVFKKDIYKQFFNLNNKIKAKENAHFHANTFIYKGLDPGNYKRSYQVSNKEIKFFPSAGPIKSTSVSLNSNRSSFNSNRFENLILISKKL